jgi:hypothetical protein
MSTHWREPLDPSRHRDWMSTAYVGGVPARAPADRLVPAFAYFVSVCGFTFEFVSLEQIREAINWFRTPHPGSSRLPEVTLEHYWQRWHERLPPGLTTKENRAQITAALESALVDFDPAARRPKRLDVP